MTVHLYGSIACAVAAGSIADPPEPVTFADRQEILAELAGIIAASIPRIDSRHPVFHGCFDWHSAVHAHWAILRLARATGGHAALAESIAARLESKDLDQERADLLRRTDFEMPYGRAWFLRLHIEYELWCREQHRTPGKTMTAMADELAESLAQRYRDRAPSPATREYANDSWAITQLHAYFAQRGNDSARREVAAWIDKYFLENEAPVRFRFDFQRPDFFSPFGNWAYLIAETQEPDRVARFWARFPIGDQELQPVDPLLPQAHHAGINWSRAWSMRSLARALSDPGAKERLERSYQEHVATGLAQHRKFVGNYRAYDHWVPQFAVYALTE